MNAVLIKSTTFLLIVSLGYILKKRGFFKKEDSNLISSIVAKITLPCALLSGATSLIFSSTTLIILLVAFFANLIMAALAKSFFSKNTNIEKGAAMISTSGYNVGNISIPFIQAFFPGVGISYACMFDIGNSLSWLGGVYAWANHVADDENSKFSIMALIKTLAHSIPFLTYMLILVLGIFKLSLPLPVHAFVSTIGASNSFLVMLMIGIMLEFNMSKAQFKKVTKVISLRFIGFITICLLVYFVLPLPLLAKQVLMLCVVPSIPSIAIVFSKELGDETPLPALINSISLLIGIICSSVILMLFR